MMRNSFVVQKGLIFEKFYMSNDNARGFSVQFCWNINSMRGTDRDTWENFDHEITKGGAPLNWRVVLKGWRLEPKEGTGDGDASFYGMFYF